MDHQEFIVRDAGEGDVASLTRLARELGYEVTVDQVRSRLPARSAGGGCGAVFVAEDPAGRLLGWIQVQPRTIVVDSFAELGGLIVAADQRRRGVGSALLDAAEAWARSNGFNRFRVRSNVLRDAAAGFYQARGFRREKTQNVFLKESDLR